MKVVFEKDVLMSKEWNGDYEVDRLVESGEIDKRGIWKIESRGHWGIEEKVEFVDEEVFEIDFGKLEEESREYWGEKFDSLYVDNCGGGLGILVSECYEVRWVYWEGEK